MAAIAAARVADVDIECDAGRIRRALYVMRDQSVYWYAVVPHDFVFFQPASAAVGDLATVATCMRGVEQGGDKSSQQNLIPPPRRSSRPLSRKISSNCSVAPVKPLDGLGVVVVVALRTTHDARRTRRADL